MFRSIKGKVIILRKDIMNNKIKKYFEKDDFFSTKDLLKFYKTQEPDLKDSTFRWRIYDLKQHNIIREIKRGLYAFGSMEVFNPGLSEVCKRVVWLIQQKFPLIQYCVWETKWLNEFMLHQTNRNFIIIEIEKSFENSVFSALQENIENLFILPSPKEIDNYITSLKESCIIIQLLTQAPIQKLNKINLPKIEKIIVDVYADQNMFYFYQGKEFIHIIENSYDRYGLNMSTLFRYAERRKVHQRLKELLIKKSNIPDNIIISNGGTDD
jgi:hypothetical protein